MGKHDLAFPYDYPKGEYVTGLTKREYYAARAMQGLLDNNKLVDKSGSKINIASEAVKNAEALLELLG